MHDARWRALVVLALFAGCATPEGGDPVPTTPRPGFANGAPLGETRLFAPLGEPGQPEGIAIADGLVFVTLSQDAHTYGEVLGYDLASGELRVRIVVPKEPGDPQVDLSRLLGVAADAEGDLYVADTSVPRVLRIDRSTAPPTLSDHAIIPELAACAPLLAAPPCSPTTTDKPSLVNYPAFAPDGTMYVTDTFQATIFRIPPGGGDAEVWFQDARLGDYGPNGLAFGPGDTHLYVGQTIAEPVSAVATGVAGGAVYRIPLVESPSATDMMLFHHYPEQAVDGISFGASGRLYVTLVGQNVGAHGISVLDAAGEEIAFFPTAEENAQRDVQFFFPASVAFDDERRSILITNQAFGHPEWWAILEAFVDDTALPLHRP